MNTKIDMKIALICTLLMVCVAAGAACSRRVASAPPAPQPAAAPAPAPTASLTADRTTIDAGGAITLQWTTENAEAVQISELGEVSDRGSAQVSPSGSTSYVLTATGPGGTASDVVRVTVNTPAPPAQPAQPAPGITMEESFRQRVQDVYFDYDRADLRSDQVNRLDVLAEWMRANPAARIVVEGHGDERGNSEYNLGLGDRRSHAARTYLVNRGIDAGRIQTLSYGEERPVCTVSGESCWSQNRRAHFVLAGASS